MINKGIKTSPISPEDYTKNGSILSIIKTLEDNAKFLQQGQTLTTLHQKGAITTLCTLYNFLLDSQQNHWQSQA